MRQVVAGIDCKHVLFTALFASFFTWWCNGNFMHFEFCWVFQFLDLSLVLLAKDGVDYFGEFDSHRIWVGYLSPTRAGLSMCTAGSGPNLITRLVFVTGILRAAQDFTLGWNIDLQGRRGRYLTIISFYLILWSVKLMNINTKSFVKFVLHRKQRLLL